MNRHARRMRDWYAKELRKYYLELKSRQVIEKRNKSDRIPELDYLNLLVLQSSQIH